MAKWIEETGFGWRLRKPVKEDGSIDWDAYSAVQNKGNHDKIGAVWATKGNIRFIAGMLLAELRMPPKFGICHGTRRGCEQEWFEEALPGCEVVGTEIGESATTFPRTVRWDFHDENPEWTGRADFVYSNAFDHSIDPRGALETWRGQLREGGAIFLEFGGGNIPANVSDLDPFGMIPEVIPWLMLKWGGLQVIGHSPLPEGPGTCCFIGRKSVE